MSRIVETFFKPSKMARMQPALGKEDEVQMVMESVADEAQDNDLSDEGALEAFE